MFPRLKMSESIHSHILLCECLAFSQGKTRPTDHTGKSKFLSSLALVLNGNATCTAVYVHQADRIVFIARNESITPTDQRYFDRFFRQIRIYANLCFDKDKEAIISEAKDQLESLIFEYNAEKIINRIIGRNDMFINELREMIRWNTNEKSPFIEELQSNPQLYRDHPSTTEEYYLIKQNYTEKDYVEFLFKTLGKFLVARDQLIENQVNPTDQHLILAIRLAWVLYQSRLFQYILDHSDGTCDKGVYYFEKTSAHRRSINLLLKCLLYRKDYVGEIYKNITWKLVPSIKEIQPLSITPRQAFEKIFTNICNSSDQNICNVLEKISSETFYNQHLGRMKRFDNDRIHVGHLHAEILLIDHLLKNNINMTNHSKEVEIGISKMPCLLCSYYIDALNIKYDRCFYQCNSTNGKIYLEWTYRHNEDPSILNLINQKLIDQIQRSIEKLCLEIDRGHPKKSGDSDIMFTSMEGDEFDKSEYRQISP